MAMRRPRIKPVANILLNSKRKTKSINEIKTSKLEESDANSEQKVEKVINDVPTQKEKYADFVDNPVKVIPESSVDTPAKENKLNNKNTDENVGSDKQKFENNVKGNIKNINEKIIVEKNLSNTRDQKLKNTNEDVIDLSIGSDAFKCPKVGFQRTINHTSNSGIDDVFYTDIEENALQMDFEKSQSNNCPISPSKNSARQRIRPTPHFGQRRNSFVGSSSSPHTSGNDESNASNSNANSDLVPSATRRERHHSSSFAGNSSSGSSNSHHHTTHKYLPSGVTNSSTGRVRTESCCSNLSDTNTSTHKLRKTEDHKQDYRKDFEARFHNGVPAKNVLKMSDLIYYNPVTNPMEQKPNPKQEPTETSSKDDNTVTEVPEKKDISGDSEAVPVPQLKLNAKGELILDDSSLVIETTAEQEARKVLANSSLIYLDEHTGMNGFYSRKKRTRKWPASETVKFYRCLQNVGTDFSLMVSLFPNRTRRDLKLKFKKEERKNFHLISKAIVHPKQFDIESLKQQLDEEEKLLDKYAKANKKKPCKSEKKKKINAPSSASRVLSKGSIYQNEIAPKQKGNKTNNSGDKSKDSKQKEKKTIESCKDSLQSEHKPKEAKKKASKKLNKEQIPSNNNENLNSDANSSNKAGKKQRIRTYKKIQKKDNIKEEIVKIESRSENIKQISASIEYRDTKEIQTEIDELLDSDAIDIQYGITSYEASNIHVSADTSEVVQFTEEINNAFASHIEEQDDTIEIDIDIDSFDDDSVEVYSNIKDDMPSTLPAANNRSPSPQLSSESSMCAMEIENNSEVDINNDTCSTVISEQELSEADIQSILKDLAEGSLVLVSSLDPDNPDKVLNEIYMVDKNTGELCDEPLSIPDNIVQCILTVVS